MKGWQWSRTKWWAKWWQSKDCRSAYIYKWQKNVVYLVSETMEKTKQCWRKVCKNYIRSQQVEWQKTKGVFSVKNNGNKIYLEVYGLMAHFAAILLVFYWCFAGISLYQPPFQFGYLSLLWVPPDFMIVQFFSWFYSIHFQRYFTSIWPEYSTNNRIGGI